MFEHLLRDSVYKIKQKFILCYHSSENLKKTEFRPPSPAKICNSNTSLIKLGIMKRSTTLRPVNVIDLKQDIYRKDSIFLQKLGGLRKSQKHYSLSKIIY